MWEVGLERDGWMGSLLVRKKSLKKRRLHHFVSNARFPYHLYKYTKHASRYSAHQKADANPVMSQQEQSEGAGGPELEVLCPFACSLDPFSKSKPYQYLDRPTNQSPF